MSLQEKIKNTSLLNKELSNLDLYMLAFKLAKEQLKISKED